MKFKRTVLPSGLRIITAHMQDNPTVTVLVMVEAGSLYEAKELNGISHFLEHMCFKGTTRRPKAIDLSRELEGIGSHYNAFTSQEFTGYYAKSNAKHLDKILDVVSDLYLNPLFPQSEIEKEKGVITDEISMYEDSPSDDVHSVFSHLLHGDQPAGLKVTGSKESVSKLTRDDLVAYRKQHYVAKTTTVVVAGNFDEQKIEQQITEKFSGMSLQEKIPMHKTAVSQSAPRVMVKNRKTDQTHIVLGVRSYDAHSKKIPGLRVLSTLLGGGMSSRLFQKLRDEMGAGYYVHSSVDVNNDHGHLAVSIGVEAARSKEVIQAIIGELKKLADKLVSAEELQHTKDFMIGNMFLGLESSDSIADFYGFQEVMGRKIEHSDDVAAKIQEVTIEEVQQIAKELFVDEHLNLALVGPFENGSEFLPLLTF